MKITLNQEQTIKGKDYAAGDTATVLKELGERLVAEGIANRIIEVPENRMTAIRFSDHRKIFQGSDGKKYQLQGKTYIEVEE